MKTQRINLLEAMNLALAGHQPVTYESGVCIKLKKDELAVYQPDGVRGVKLNSSHIKSLKDDLFHCGDDRSIRGYYEE